MSVASLNYLCLSLHRILRNSQPLKDITWRSIRNFKYPLRNIWIVIRNSFTPLKIYGCHQTEFHETWIRATFFSKRTSVLCYKRTLHTHQSLMTRRRRTNKQMKWHSFCPYKKLLLYFLNDIWNAGAKVSIPKLILSTIKVTYRHRCNNQCNHRCDETSSLVCLHC